MALGIALSAAVLSLVLAGVAILFALIALGKMVALQKRVDDAEIRLAGVEGHRIRLETNMVASATRVGLLIQVNGIPMAPSPERPQ